MDSNSAPFNYEVKYMLRDIIDDKPRKEWEELIEQWVHDEQGRYILTRNLLDGISYERIAEELDISRATVYLKYKKWEPKLFNHS